MFFVKKTGLILRDRVEENRVVVRPDEAGQVHAEVADEVVAAEL